MSNDIFKKAAEVLFIEVDQRREVRYVDFFLIIFSDKGQYCFDILHAFVVIFCCRCKQAVVRLKAGKPVLGICKGMQLINVYFGGNIVQNMTADQLAVHSYGEEDSYHLIFFNRLSPMPLKNGSGLFPEKIQVNSAHHQCIDHLGQGLTTIQYSLDYVPETIAHISLPVLGFQWHPERLFRNGKDSLGPFLHYFLKGSCFRTFVLL